MPSLLQSLRDARIHWSVWLLLHMFNLSIPRADPYPYLALPALQALALACLGPPKLRHPAASQTSEGAHLLRQVRRQREEVSAELDACSCKEAFSVTS